MKFNFLKNKKILFIITLLIITFSIIFVNSLSNSNGLLLREGKNKIIFNETNSFNASTLIKLNPGVEVVSYKEGNITFGYINFMGGLGDDFEIRKGVSYEIYSSKNTTLIFPK